MDPRISIVTLGVSDLERSRRFYAEGLGLPLAPQSNERIAFFALHGAWLALFPRDHLAADAAVDKTPVGGFSGVTIANNVASRAEVDAVLQQAVAAGARITKPGTQASWGGYSGYFTDPDGYLWEVAWNPLMPELATRD